MGWIMIPAKSMTSDEFRLCHECGKKIMRGNAHIMTHQGSWVFHPECGIVYQARELNLERAVAKQLRSFADECKKEN